MGFLGKSAKLQLYSSSVDSRLDMKISRLELTEVDTLAMQLFNLQVKVRQFVLQES